MWLDLPGLSDIDTQIAQETIADGVDPPVDADLLLPRPGIGNDVGSGDIEYLFDDVQFTEAVEPKPSRW